MTLKSDEFRAAQYLGASLLRSLPRAVKVTFEVLARAPYPLADAKALAAAIPRDEIGSVAETVQGLVSLLARRAEFPLKDAESAIAALARSLPGIVYPIPGRPPFVRRPPSDFDPDGDMLFPSDACGQAAARYADEHRESLTLNGLGSLRGASRSCALGASQLPSTGCGEPARAVYAETYIEVMMRDEPRDPFTFPDLRTRRERQQEAHERALAAANLVYVLCLSRWGTLRWFELLSDSSG